MLSGTVRILSILLFHYFCSVQSGRMKRVIGGSEVACGTQPRIGSLRNSTSLQHLCGTTLISPRFAVTAAHCLVATEDQYVVQLNNFCHGDAVTAEVQEIIVHDSFDEFSRAHDIALMRISLPINDTSWLGHSVLPSSSFGLSGNCTIYGYGYRDLLKREISDKLLAGDMQLVSLDECIKVLGPYLAPKSDMGMLCALGDGVDSCQGDSGGPLMCNGLVEAISSYGMSCGVPGRPGVYTSLGPHLQWIRDIVKNEKL